MITRLLGARLRGQAKSAARRGDWASAADAYGRLVAKRLAGPRDLVQFGHAIKEMGDFDAAGEVYRDAAIAHPRDLDVQRQYGLFLRRVGRTGEAVEVLSRILALAPESTDLRADLASLGIDDEALDERLLTASLRGDERPSADRERLERRVDALLGQGDIDQALRLCRGALFDDPRSSGILLLLAEALDAAGRPQAALQAALAAWRLQPGLPAAAAALHRRGWGDTDLERLTVTSWAPTDPAAQLYGGLHMPDGLDARARTIWTHLAAAMGEGG